MMRCAGVSLLAFAFSVVLAVPAAAAPFQNLDFEQATVMPAAPGYFPENAGAYDPLDSAAALPYWTVTEDTTVCTAVFGEANILDLSSVALGYSGDLYQPNPESPATPPVQGNYDVQLYAVANVPDPPLFETASISQVGDVPSTAKSIRFLIRNPPGDSNIPSVPFVFLNGVSIPVIPISTSGGISTMAGDVSAFAGTSAELTFEAEGQSGLNAGFAREDIFELDDISFSPNPIPEPASAALLLAALPLLAIRRLRRACSPMTATATRTPSPRPIPCRPWTSPASRITARLECKMKSSTMSLSPSSRNLLMGVAIAAALIAPRNAALAQVVPETQIRFGSEPTPTDEYEASVDQEPSGNGTAVVFAFTGSTLGAVNWTLDEGSDWYLANTGDALSATTIAAGDFPVLLDTPAADKGPPGPTVSIPLGDFYLGMTTSNELDSRPGRDVFGWLELDNTGTELIPVDNAVAYYDQGIIIGTTTPVVPEPASAALLLVGLPLLTFRRRRA